MIPIQPNKQKIPRRKETVDEAYYFSEGEPTRARGAALNAFIFALVFAGVILVSLGSVPSVRERLGLPPMRNADATPGRHTTNVRITEVMSSNSHTLMDEYGVFSDWVEIENIGEQAEDITGFILTDDASRDRFVFPQTVLEPRERVIVFASGRSESESLLHAPFKIKSAGEMLYLKNASGELVEYIGVNPLHADTSFALIDGAFRAADKPTPGYENSEEGREAFERYINLDADAIIITEIMASNSKILHDGDGDAPDWIEIYNTRDYAVDVSRLALSDNPNKPAKWRFPNGTVLQPHECMVIFASDKNKSADGELHTNFKLAANHGVVILSSQLGFVVESVEYDNMRPDVSYKRNGNSAEWKYDEMPTPGRTGI
ncbi:MAG: lamin tail domain-containing protein [Oscillospiraceae bacterium]|nr:lamin tail domain-containing protein [Oscillospiraceae bacterium]